MKQQNDWYTGIDYYHNELEKNITVERIRVQERSRSCFHELVEIYYIFSGKASMEINGCVYEVGKGSFLCLYAHHFYRFVRVEEPVEAAVVRFHIGLFMYMSWEKHPRNANARLVYDACPAVSLQGEDRERVRRLAEELLTEQEQGRFEYRNMLEYKTLELHAYHCRFAFEAIGKEPEQRRERVWLLIPRVLLAASRRFTLEEAAADFDCGPSALNRSIKDACGFTFHQLSLMGVWLNACALLHFPELNMEYISDMLGFSSVQSFYRLFSRQTGMTPREYQGRLTGEKPEELWAASAGIRFLQYMHLRFYEDLTLDSLCEAFCLKRFTAEEIFKNAFRLSFPELLGQIRVCYACAFLRSTRRSVLGVSQLCGFESVSTFQRAFSRWMGQTPGEYRRSFRE